MFLLMIFLDFIFEDRDIEWLGWLERRLSKLGKVDMLSVCVALIVLLITAMTFATHAHLHAGPANKADTETSRMPKTAIRTRWRGRSACRYSATAYNCTARGSARGAHAEPVTARSGCCQLSEALPLRRCHSDCLPTPRHWATSCPACRCSTAASKGPAPHYRHQPRTYAPRQRFERRAAFSARFRVFLWSRELIRRAGDEQHGHDAGDAITSCPGVVGRTPLERGFC
jgi:hypothetical protein